jgi:threonine dehydrogenase-like Zn-dependent dehydrogenase
MAEMVRAAVLVEPGKIEIREFPKPSLAEGGLLVKPIMAGICESDVHFYKGESVQYAGTPRETFGPYPAIPGHENVGVIVEARHPRDRKITDFYGKELHEGDRIIISPDMVCGNCYWCHHTYGFSWCDNLRSYGHIDASVPPHLFGGWSELLYVLPGSHLYKISDDVSDEIAVLAEPMAVTFSLDIAKGHSSLPNEGFTTGDTVVVFGVSPVGLCHLVKSRLLGAGTIIAIDKSEFRLNFVKNFGATYTLNVTKTTQKDRNQFIKDLTDGRGADVVVECAGVPEVVIEGIEMLRQGGTFVEVGHFVDAGDIQLNPHRHLCAKSIRLIGQVNLAYTGIMPSVNLMKANQDKYNFNNIVTHKFPLAKALDGLFQFMKPDSMKVVICPQTSP